MPSVSRPNQNSPPAPRIQLQFDFAVDAAPPRVRECGLAEMHFWPLVSLGRPFHDLHRTPVDRAWRYPELELDSAMARTALILDVDHDFWECLTVAQSAAVHPPTWICTSPRGHSHVVYLLKRPVLKGLGTRWRPLATLARISEYYTRAYAADTAYAGVLTHNPVHGRYADSTTWWSEDASTLAQLADPIPHRWQIPRRPQTADGRNVALFRASMRFFGKARNWDDSRDPEAVFAWIEATCDEWYPPPRLGWHPKETWWIAKSVARICAKNLDSGQTQAGFARIQSARGRRSGAKRRQGTPLELDRQPWLALEISRPTWYRHGGLPAPTTTALRPWEIEGISRRTWYRRIRGA